MTNSKNKTKIEKLQEKAQSASTPNLAASITRRDTRQRQLVGSLIGNEKNTNENNRLKVELRMLRRELKSRQKTMF